MSRNTRSLIVFLVLILVSLVLWYFEVIGMQILIVVLLADVVTFFAIRTANSNLDKSNRDLKR